MRLSIVVPVYNVEAYLRRCLRSLLAQELDPSDYEVLVINDGSEDGSLEIATSFTLNNRTSWFILRRIWDTARQEMPGSAWQRASTSTLWILMTT